MIAAEIKENIKRLEYTLSLNMLNKVQRRVHQNQIKAYKEMLNEAKDNR